MTRVWAVALPLLLGWSTALAQAGRTPLSFEVASLKPIPLPADTGNDYADGYNAGARAALSGMGLRIAGQRVTATETSLRDLIHIAYQVQDGLLSGPSWMATEKFDLVATMPAGVDRSEAPEMLRTLLEERFHLKLHRETKRMSVYALVAARGGPKLKASAPPANGVSPNPRTLFQPGMLMTRSASLAAFADLISKASDRPVVDATGLKGLYDIDLRYSPDPRDVPPDGEPRPTLVTGLQEQLGLRLQSRNQQMELLVIDSADKVPVENWAHGRTQKSHWWSTIDYTQQDYTKGGAQYDLIIDNVGNHSLSANRRVLKPNGRYVMIGGSKGKWLKPIDRVIAAMMYSKFVHQQMGMMLTRASKDDLALLARLMEQGKVTPVSRARGKVVIQME